MNTEFLCKVWDRLITENEIEYYNYLATSRKKDDKSVYINYTITNNNLDEFAKILNDYISHHKKTVFYFVNLTFGLKFNDDFIQCIDTNFFYMEEINNMKSNLLYCVNFYKSRGYDLYNINELVIKSLNDRCNMTYQQYISQPVGMCERKIIMNIARNPELLNSLDRKENHPLIRKYSHMPFNN